jgi:hypothetical protein
LLCFIWSPRDVVFQPELYAHQDVTQGLLFASPGPYLTILPSFCSSIVPKLLLYSSSVLFRILGTAVGPESRTPIPTLFLQALYPLLPFTPYSHCCRRRLGLANFHFGPEPYKSFLCSSSINVLFILLPSVRTQRGLKAMGHQAWFTGVGIW